MRYCNPHYSAHLWCLALRVTYEQNKIMLLPMKVDVVLGLQWGDEGKGKVVDLCANTKI